MYRQPESRIAELSTEDKQVSHLADINLKFERVRAGLDAVSPQL